VNHKTYYKESKHFTLLALLLRVIFVHKSYKNIKYQTHLLILIILNVQLHFQYYTCCCLLQTSIKIIKIILLDLLLLFK